MKNTNIFLCYLIILIVAFFSVVKAYGQFGGSTCLTAQSAPISFSVGTPFSQGIDTLYGKVDDYNSSNTNLLSSFSPLHIAGPDYLYYFTAQSTGPITIKVSYAITSTRYFSVSLFEAGSGASLGQQLSGSYDCLTAGVNPPGVLTTANVFAGNSYYILVDCWGWGLNSPIIGSNINKTKYSVDVQYNDISPSCSNPDFENGNFSNWYGTIGRIQNCKNPLATHANYCPYDLTTNNPQFSIVNGGNDPYGNFPKVFQGNYSAMIGDGTGIDAYGAELINTFLVSSQASAFTVSYAMVVQDGSHEDTIQSFAKISMFDQYGNEIECGNYLAIAAVNSNGFIQSTVDPDVSYKPWTSITTDLSPYIGELVTIKITTGDCSGLAHFGYAYIDCSCTVLELNASGCSPVTITAPPGFDSYLWSPGGQTTQSITVTTSGQYCCDVTRNGCTLNLCKDITVGSLNLTTSQINVSCNGMQDGSATISIVGTPNFSYVWSNGGSTLNTTDTTNTIGSLQVGTYIISVTDGTGCLGIDTVNITGPPPLVVDAGLNQTICYGIQTTISAAVSGGVGPYSYLWNNGAGSLDSSVVSPPYGTTNYMVTVTDACGSVSDQVAINVIYCCFVDSINYQLSYCTPSANMYSVSGQVYFTNPPPTGVLTITNNCSGSSISFNPPFANPMNFAFNDLMANGNSCSINAVFSAAPTCTLNNIYSAPATVNVTPCNGIVLTCTSPSGVISATSNYPGVNYLWTGPGIVSGASTSSPTVNIAGTYNVVVTDPISGCTASGTVNVTSNMTPPVIAMGSQLTLTCQTTSGLISVVANPTSSNFSWTGPSIVSGATTLSPTVNAAGVYTVIVTNPVNGCTTSGTTTVLLDTITPGVVSVPTTLIPCNPHAAIISATSSTSGVNYTWTGPGVPANDVHLPSPTINQAGLYTVVVTNPANGCTSSGTVNVISSPIPVSSISNLTNVSCKGLKDGSATVAVTGGTPPYIYQWNDHFVQVTATANNLASDTYLVLVTDASGCTTSSSVNISEPALLQILTNQNVYSCYNQPVNITVNTIGGTGPSYTYIWSNLATTSFITVYPQPPDSIYSVVVTDEHGCTASTSIKVNVSQPVNVSLISNIDSVCPGEPVLLIPVITGGVEPFVIFNQDGQIVSPPIYVYPTSTGNYLINVEDSCGNNDTSNIYIYVHPLPTGAIFADKLYGCQPLTVHFNETTPNIDQTYQWNFGNENYSNYSIVKSPTHTFTESGIYDVSLTITSNFGCKKTYFHEDMITVHPFPVANFDPIPNVASIVDASIYFENYSIGASSYYWSFGDGDSSIIKDPVHDYSLSGINEYQIRLIAETDKGCKDTIIKSVRIKDEFTFYAPNAFSPDNDGVNDIFYVLGNGIDEKTLEMFIYDRWGEKIYGTNEYSNEYPEATGWNGLVKEKKKGEVGFYTWIVIYRDIQGVEHQKAGMVNLIR